MKLFLDTAHLHEIREALDLGVIEGVTTNPTHVSKTGRPAYEVYREICELVPGPVSVEAVSTRTDEIVREARELAKIADNAVVKIPVTPDGLKAVQILSKENIQTNVTVVFSPLQALLAAKCGATYVSPFVGRLDVVGHDGMVLVEQIRKIYDNYGFQTQVLVAAVRHPQHVLQAALLGADACTMRLETLKQLYQHPLTDAGIAQFLADWAKVPQTQK